MAFLRMSEMRHSLYVRLRERVVHILLTKFSSSAYLAQTTQKIGRIFDTMLFHICTERIFLFYIGHRSIDIKMQICI